LLYRISDLNFRDDVQRVMLEKRGVINKEKKNKELLSEFLLKEYLK
jgi:hypothetical protein